MHHSRLLTAAALVLTLTACGGGATDPNEAEIKADLSATFQKGEPPLTEEQADCLAELVIDQVGVKQLNDVDLSADEPPEEIADELAVATVRARDECDITSG